jgi:ABC-type ATPase involved in cell division/GNAT superfamily N-acetyltransferase
MHANVTVSSPLSQTPRVLQVASMFDVPSEGKASLTLNADLPVEERDWSVGLITGPSGAGKTTLARQLWPDAMAAAPEWNAAALVDDFPEPLGIRDVIGLLTAVGLSSPPAWIRPYATLSTGEAFRAQMARLIAETRPGEVTVVDEFTSTVDRQVAKVASHAVQKAIRREHRRLVAVTCHYDVVDWLQPDWVFDAAAGLFTWRSVQPHPPLRLDVHAADKSLWPMFARHHYLNGALSSAAQCFAGWIGGYPVAFNAYLHFPHPHTKTIKMGHRLVVLPDYQGLGIGGRFDDWLGQYLSERGYRYRKVIAHPALIRYFAASPRWRDTTAAGKHLSNTSRNTSLRRQALNPRRLVTRSFQYSPPS